MEILSAKDWYNDQLRKQTGKTMSHFELAENYSKYLLEKQERSYSDGEVLKILYDFSIKSYSPIEKDDILMWFEQFKKK